MMSRAIHDPDTPVNTRPISIIKHLHLKIRRFWRYSSNGALVASVHMTRDRREKNFSLARGCEGALVCLEGVHITDRRGVLANESEWGRGIGAWIGVDGGTHGGSWSVMGRFVLF